MHLDSHPLPSQPSPLISSECPSELFITDTWAPCSQVSVSRLYRDHHLRSHLRLCSHHHLVAFSRLCFAKCLCCIWLHGSRLPSKSWLPWGLWRGTSCLCFPASCKLVFAPSSRSYACFSWVHPHPWLKLWPPSASLVLVQKPLWHQHLHFQLHLEAQNIIK